jgi:uncharacterized oligopeptide transporter (OPT) family protein
MPCLLVLAIALFPRVVLVLLWLFSNMLDRAYHGLVIPLLGFFFLPITTIVYAWMVTSHLPIAGVNLLILIVAVLLDAGSHGGNANYYQNSRRV